MPTVVLVGRPNVGKSTLFNRFLGEERSIVEPTPGVTRDRIEGTCKWNRKSFTLVDTGGILQSNRDVLHDQVLKQVDFAVSNADLILFVTDVKAGATPLDQEIAQHLRVKKPKQPVLVIANKGDNLRDELSASDLYSLGFGSPFFVSALHGIGIGDLLDEIIQLLPEEEAQNQEPVLQFCMVGRPNVGKSSLVNALLGESRVIVHDEPGTTRDSVDVAFTYQDKPLLLVDTAGLRKRSKASESIEFFSRTRTVRAITRSQVAVLVLEANRGVLAQDQRIAGEVEEQGKGVVILVNKWDTIPSPKKSTWKDFVNHVRTQLRFIQYAPVIPTSATTAFGIDKIIPTVMDVYVSWKQTIPPSELKSVFREAVLLSPPPSMRQANFRIKGISFVKSSPPTLVVRTTKEVKLPNSYLQYLENKFRENFDLQGTPLRILVRDEASFRP